MARNLKKLKDNIVTITDYSQNEFEKFYTEAGLRAYAGIGPYNLPIHIRQYRIILSADTASEVRQMLSQKRR